MLSFIPFELDQCCPVSLFEAEHWGRGQEPEQQELPPEVALAQAWVPAVGALQADEAGWAGGRNKEDSVLVVDRAFAY